MADMPKPKLPYLQHERTRHGKWLWYVRMKKGPRVRIEGDYGTPEFLAAYRAAIEGKVAPRRSVGSEEGTFSWALDRYRRSQAWASLSNATRRQRENIFKHIVAVWGSGKIAKCLRGDIVAGRDKRADRPAAARHFVEALRGLFQWALESGLVKADPTQGVKVAKPRSEGFAVWTPEDIAACRKHWPIGTRERVALEVLYGTGLRRGDAARVGRPHLRDGVIRITTEKTGERVSIAVSDDLERALDAGPIGDMTFIAGKQGLPMTKESLGNWLRDVFSAAGVCKSAHGIRKRAATDDAEAGWSDAELDAKYGWTGRKMASLYTRAASREKLSLGAAARTKNRTDRPAPRGEGSGQMENIVNISKVKS